MLKIAVDKAMSRPQDRSAYTPPRTPSYESLDWKPNVWNPACLPITPPPEQDTSEPVLFNRREVASFPSDISPEDDPRVAVLGIGYVGTHLVSSFSSKYPVIAFDVSERRIAQLQAEQSSESNISYTTDPQQIRNATHILISVPTLLRQDKTIDASYLQSALNTVSTHARAGATIVIESSVAVGMTRNLLGPICEAHSFMGGMSPEVCSVCPIVVCNSPD